MKALHIISFVLLVIGGLNWLLFAFQWDLGRLLGPSFDSIMTIVYLLVGLAAIFELVTHKQNCKACTGGNAL